MMDHRVIGGKLTNGKISLICACGEITTTTREHPTEDLNLKSEAQYRRHLSVVTSASERTSSGQN